MEMTSRRNLTIGSQIHLLHLGILPGASAEHFSGELSFQFDTLRSKVGSLGDFVGLLRNNGHKLALFEQINILFVVFVDIGLVLELQESNLVFIFELLNNSLHIFFLFAANLDPLVLHSLRETDLCKLSPNFLLHISFRDFFSDSKRGGVLEFRGSRFGVASSFFGEFENATFNDLQNDIFVNVKTFEG